MIDFQDDFKNIFVSVIVCQNDENSFGIYKDNTFYVETFQQDLTKISKCKRRFSDFEYLRNKLIKETNYQFLPDLPEKNLMCKITIDQQFLKNMAIGLVLFLNKIIQIEKVQNSLTLKKFFNYDYEKFQGLKKSDSVQITLKNNSQSNFILSLAETTYNYYFRQIPANIQQSKYQDPLFDKFQNELQLIKQQRDILQGTLNCLKQLIKSKIHKAQQTIKLNMIFLDIKKNKFIEINHDEIDHNIDKIKNYNQDQISIFELKTNEILVQFQENIRHIDVCIQVFEQRQQNSIRIQTSIQSKDEIQIFQEMTQNLTEDFKVFKQQIDVFIGQNLQEIVIVEQQYKII